MRDKRVYVAAAVFLTLTTMAGTMMAGCGSGGSHLNSATGATTRQLTWGGDGDITVPTATPAPVEATPVPMTRQLTWGGDGDITAPTAPASTPAPVATPLLTAP